MDRRDFSFSHPLFELHPLALFALRVFSSAFCIILGMAVLVGLLSGVPLLFWGSLLTATVFFEGALFGGLSRRHVSLGARGARVEITRRLSPRLCEHLSLSLFRAYVSSSPIFFHLLVEFLRSSEVRSLLARLDVPISEFAARARERVQGETRERLGSVGGDRRALKLLAEEAFYIAEANGELFITPAHFFAALRRRASLYENLERFFALFEIEEEHLSLLTLLGEEPRGDRRFAPLFARFSSGLREALSLPLIPLRFAISSPTPTLCRFGEELPHSRLVGRGAILVGHQRERGELLQILALKRRRFGVLVGSSHSGRDALVSHLAHAIRTGSLPELSGCRVFQLDLTRLIEQKTPREIRGLADALAGELARSPRTILYLPSIERLFSLSLETRTALEAVVSLLLSGRARAIASLEASCLRRFADHPLLRDARLVRMARLNREEFLEFLFRLCGELERLHGVTILLDALVGIASLAETDSETMPSPHVAARLLTQAMLSLVGRGGRVLTAHDLLLEVRRQSFLPLPRAAASLVRTPLAKRLIAALGGRAESLVPLLRLLSVSRDSFDARVFPPLLLVNFSDERAVRVAGLLASFCFGSRARLLTFRLAELADGGGSGSGGQRASRGFSEAKLSPFELFLSELLHASLETAGCVFFFPRLERVSREFLTPLRELARRGVFMDESRPRTAESMIDARHALIIGSVALVQADGEATAEEALASSLPGDLAREFIPLFARAGE